MKPLFTTLATIFLCLPAFTCLAGDTATYFLRHFDNSNGLPQNSVNAIIRDKRGYVWFTTENGLVRFDGTRFKVVDVKDIGLKSNRFYTIFLDTAGNAGALNEKAQAAHIVEGVAMRYPFHPEEGHSYLKWYHPEVAAHFGTSYTMSLPRKIGQLGAKLGELKLYRDEKSFYLYRNDTVSYVRDGSIRYALPFRGDDRWNFFVLDKRFFHLENDGRVTEYSEQPKHSVLKGDILGTRFIIIQTG